MVRSLVAALMCLGLVISPAKAQAPCGDIVEVDDHHYLRQLTLDLWGRVPTVTELDALVESGGVTDTLVDHMLDDPRFSRFVERHHRDLLWPNVQGFSLVNPGIALLLPASFYEMDATPERLFVLYVGLYGRGGLVPCKDEPAEFDAEGYPIMEAWPDGTMRDGWVEVEPYWAPGTTVKVCALEARTVAADLFGQPCNTFQGMASGSCGCGPMLEHCLSPDSATIILASLQEQTMKRITDPIDEGRSYYDALTDPDDLLDGPLVHYYRHLVPMAVEPLVYMPPVTLADLPTDVPFADASWERYPRHAGPHSGVLTSLLFMLRFQTARARANRFYDAFLCAPFLAPSLDLPSPNDPCSMEPDLRLRCGCNGCHIALEPAAAHWASFVDDGTMYLDPALFPAFNSSCVGCQDDPGGCAPFCELLYLTEAGHPDEKKYVGMLKAYLFRTPDEVKRLKAGPASLVAERLESGALPRCTARKVFERLHGRAMTLDERLTVLGDVTDEFEASGYDFKTLVKTWVTSPSYRRMAP